MNRRAVGNVLVGGLLGVMLGAIAAICSVLLAQVILGSAVEFGIDVVRISTTLMGALLGGTFGWNFWYEVPPIPRPRRLIRQLCVGMLLSLFPITTLVALIFLPTPWWFIVVLMSGLVTVVVVLLLKMATAPVGIGMAFSLLLGAGTIYLLTQNIESLRSVWSSGRLLMWAVIFALTGIIRPETLRPLHRRIDKYL